MPNARHFCFARCSNLCEIRAANREKELAELKKRVAPADYTTLEKPGQFEALTQILARSMPAETKGAEWDLRLYTRDIGFPLEEIKMPLHLFHGAEDANAPLALVRKMTARIPDARLVVYQTEAHFSTLCHRVDEFLPVLLHGN